MAGDKGLSQAETADEAAGVATELLRTGTDRAAQVVADYAAASDLRAFDLRHEVLLIHDASNGNTHTIYAGPRGESVDTGDPGLDRAITAAMSEITGSHFSIGEPPKHFAEVRPIESTHDHADFILEPDVEGASYRVRFEFDGNRLVSKTIYDYQL